MRVLAQNCAAGRLQAAPLAPPARAPPPLAARRRAAGRAAVTTADDRGTAPSAAAAAAADAAAAASAAQAAAPAPEGLARRPQLLTPGWEYAIALLESGEVICPKVVSVNKAGLVVRVTPGDADEPAPGAPLVSGFIPFKLLDRKRLKDGSANARAELSALVGERIAVRVTQVVVPERRLICSEKAAMLDAAARALAPGDVLEGRVISLHDFGAFVEVAEPHAHAGAELILPMREVSWDWIPTVASKVNKGDAIRVVVVDARPPPRAKVVVSLKRLQEDPLTETLDNVLPLEGEGNSYMDLGSVPAAVPAAVEDIMAELAREAGVAGVTLGRRVEERRTVSQDLELWMSREAVAGGYNLAARAGRVVQEIHVDTAMAPEEMRAAVQRVLKRVG